MVFPGGVEEVAEGNLDKQVAVGDASLSGDRFDLSTFSIVLGSGFLIFST